MEKNYKVEIEYASKHLTPKERIKLKQIGDTISLDEVLQESQILITPDFFAVLKVHNEKSENKDYTVYIICDKDGALYRTSSDGFYNTFSDIMDEIVDCEEIEDYKIKIFTKPSNNYKGKNFITCTIV